MIHNKYPRTYHLPYSPGSTNDDKKLHEGWFEYYKGKEIVITEKLDGSNISMSQNGVCERSTSQESRQPWLRNIWDPSDGLYWKIRIYISDNETLFGENLYGEHSIHYNNLDQYFHLFAVNNGEDWYDWDAVKLFADVINVPYVPELWRGVVYSEDELKKLVEKYTSEPSVYGDEREGVVIRRAGSFKIEDFSKYVCKWVRPNHVTTDEHWTRHWKKAKLINDKI